MPSADQSRAWILPWLPGIVLLSLPEEVSQSFMSPLLVPVATVRPSLEKATLAMPRDPGERVLCNFQVVASQIHADSPGEPEASLVLSGDHLMLNTWVEWPLNVCSSVPFLGSHMRIVLSSDDEARRAPLGAQDISFIS